MTPGNDDQVIVKW